MNIRAKHFADKQSALNNNKKRYIPKQNRKEMNSLTTDANVICCVPINDNECRYGNRRWNIMLHIAPQTQIILSAENVQEMKYFTLLTAQ